jgi:hypothetical protein
MDTIIAPFRRDLSNLVALSARRFSPEGDLPDGVARFDIACHAALHQLGLADGTITTGSPRRPLSARS